jgi:TPR repeat protein
MRFWLIAIWNTVPRRWVMIAAPVVLPAVALLGWWLFGGLFIKPPDPSFVAAQAELNRILPAAEKGDRGAQMRAATIYRDGSTGKVDGAEAVRWFSEAMKRGDLEAPLMLGDLYARGLGVRQDYARAAELYRTAANFGRSAQTLAQAQYLLGDLYAYGRGLPQDYSLAVEWLRKAALRGHAGAQSYLGSFYENGYGVDRDLVEAFVWYSLAGGNQASALAYRSDIDPRASAERLKAGLNRLQLRDAERKLTETRKSIRAAG